MRSKITLSLSLLISSIFMGASAASAATTASLVASPFQSPGTGSTVVVAAVLSPADGVTTADLAYRYDPSVLTPIGVYRTTYANRFTMTSNTTMRGIVEIHLSGSTPLTGSGEVAWVQFQIAASGATTTPLSWVSVMLNGGVVATTMKSANLKIGAAPVTISAPASATSAPGTQIVIPITASAFTGASSFDISVTFNSAVLTPVSVQSSPLTSCMTTVSNVAIPGTVNIALYGLCSVSGSGTVARITFNVVGPAGSRTPLNMTRGGINEGHVATVLQDGMFLNCESIDRDGDGYTSCAGDCNDADGMVHPGAAETCNAVDDNCDGLVDNVAMPDGISALFVSKNAGDAHLSWPAANGAVMYDVVGGDLGALRTTHGDFSVATDLCLANDTAATESHDPSIPAAGDSLWYLVRGENCGGFGSFDSGDAGQVGSRDAVIAASPSHCP